MIKTADWALHLRPKGGVRGGEIVTESIPEEIIKESYSWTGKYLVPLLGQPAGNEAVRGEAVE